MRRSFALLLGVLLVAGAVVTLLVVAPRTDAQPRIGPSASTVHSAFHVDCGADSKGDGSAARPWRSVAAIAEHGPFRRGDRILFARGSTCVGRVTPSGSGTPGDPIVLGAYGDGADPVVDGGGTPEQTGAVQLTDVHDWVVQDLHVRNRPAVADGAYRSGVLVVNTAGGRLARIVLQRLHVEAVTSDPGWRDGRDPHEFGGIAVITRSGDRSAGFDDVRVVGNRVEHVGRVGIVTWNGSYPDAFDHDVVVADNDVLWADGDSVLLYGTDGGTIRGNTSAFGGALPACAACRSDVGNTASAGIWPTRSRNVVVEHNEVYGESASGGDGQGLDVDIETRNVVVQRNHVHDNEGGGILICSADTTTIRFNVFEDNGGGAFVFNCDRPSTSITITNNDVHSSAEHPAAIVRTVRGRGAIGLVLTNNIVFTAAPATWDWPGPVAASDNTLIGAHDPSEPAGSTLDGEPPLLASGTGGIGSDTLGGYAPVAGLPEAPSSAIEGPVVDLLGTEVDPARPGRGAIVAAPPGTAG